MGLCDDDDDQPDGPAENFKVRTQRCTDIPCCCIFLVATILFAILWIYAIAAGNSEKFFHGVDANGKVCGVDTNVTDFPMLYYCASSSWIAETVAMATDGANSLLVDKGKPVCVAKCPRAADSSDAAAATPLVPATIPQCAPDSTYPYLTMPVMGRYCLPDMKIYKVALDQVGESRGKSQAEFFEAISGLIIGFPILIFAFIFSLIFAYVYILLLKFCARPMIYLSLFLTFALLVGLGITLLVTSDHIGAEDVSEDMSGRASTMAKILGVICFVLAAILVCVACCCCGQVELAVASVQMAADVMFEMPSLLISPLIHGVVKGVACIIMLIGFLELVSTAGVTPQGSAGDVRTLDFENSLICQVVFYLFMVCWIVCFISAVYQFSVAYAVADWYFAPQSHGGQRKVNCCAIGEGVVIALVFHTGSLALGSIVIAVFVFIEKCLQLIEKQNQASGNNPCIAILLCCCICCVKCCGSFAEYVNKNAYVDIVITGKGFCRAVCSVMRLFTRAGTAMAILQNATFIFEILGIGCITAATGFLIYFIVNVGPFSDNSSSWFIENPVLVMIVAVLIAFAVARTFMDVFDMTSDTLLYCLAVDGGKRGSLSPAVQESMNAFHEGTRSSGGAHEQSKGLF